MTSYEVTTPSDRQCCQHDLKPHVLVMLNKADVLGTPDVPVSGVMFCPSCDCTATWSVPGFPVPAMPAGWELDILRQEVLGD